MAEEIRNEELTMDQDYVAQIEEMKRNTVSRDVFDKMKEENKKLLNALTNGAQVEGSAPVVENKSIEELRANLFNKHHTNLEYVKEALELRDRLIEEGFEDPFVPQGRQISATNEDYALAQKVAEGLQSCIEYANGDSAIFTQELQRITKDSMPRISQRRR